MGDEIANSSFSNEDYTYYRECLEKETQALGQLFDAKAMSLVSNYCGLEQEAWILNTAGDPVAENKFLLDSLNSPLLSPELSKFNIELNVTPQKLHGSGLSDMQAELEMLWRQCDDKLKQKNLQLEMIGILPTISDEALVLENMSDMKRYRALNDQVLKSRGGKPLDLNIAGKETLRSCHSDVMLESAATSLQLHRQIDIRSSARFYNASIIISAISVAISANSPLLFGKNLWEETRIPLFEQAVEVGGYGHAMHGPIKRVSFGSGYLKKNLFECFSENLAHYPVLLPVKLKPNNQFSYLRMHNGTIWRWNRPIIGFDEDGTPHLRIEHRVMSAGPTIIDEISNAAFFFGLQEYYATQSTAAEGVLSFSDAKDNFYTAARQGLQSKILWPDIAENKLKKISIQKLIKSELLDYARFGLVKLGINKDDIERYLSIVEARIISGQTGSVWQIATLEKYGSSMQGLVRAYRKNRLTDKPVHTWPI